MEATVEEGDQNGKRQRVAPEKYGWAPTFLPVGARPAHPILILLGIGGDPLLCNVLILHSHMETATLGQRMNVISFITKTDYGNA